MYCSCTLKVTVDTVEAAKDTNWSKRYSVDYLERVSLSPSQTAQRRAMQRIAGEKQTERGSPWQGPGRRDAWDASVGALTLLLAKARKGGVRTQDDV